VLVGEVLVGEVLWFQLSEVLVGEVLVGEVLWFQESEVLVRCCGFKWVSRV
jgi:hypothetical protein